MSQTSREAAIFNEARSLSAPERAAYLDRACGGDVDLRREVEDLLQAAGEAGGFLQEPARGIQRPPAALANLNAAAPSPTVSISSEKPGDRIHHYQLLEQLGEGGCGVVYLAKQEQPIHRQVALKVIKLGMDTRQVIARFEAERQVLALMDHPNIARVLDAGATESGRPFFVMELVRGVKITDYCDENHLSTTDRLGLFIQVCRAVQHAHQKGIIHRDLKPSNILVAASDGAPVPKVIDFGIAKATQGSLTGQTAFTAFEQFIGTPAYMSPEQAEMGADIDTRSDIYSLGVLLYELLTGRTPFDTQELIGAGLDEMRRTIREQEPPTPSMRLSTLAGGDLAKVAAHRQSEPPKLIRLLRGDLGWIVMKALEKDRARRYETANGLAMDIERYLRDEPVIARSPSHVDRFRKMIRRHRLAFAAISAVVGALVLGLAVSTWLFLREKESRRQAAAARERAETEAAKSQQVARFLEDMLRGAGPSVAMGRDTTLLREILDKTGARVGKEFTNQPEVEFRLRTTLTETYLDLGSYREAEQMARDSLRRERAVQGEESVEIATALDELGRAVMRLGDFNQAETIQRQALAMRRKLLGAENTQTADALNHLATVLYFQDNMSEAEAMFRETLDIDKRILGDEHPKVTTLMNNLAGVLDFQGKSAEAEAMYREVVARQKKALGDEHPTIANSLCNLGNVLRGLGKLDEAEAVHREALAMKRKLLNPAHPNIAHSLSGLAGVLRDKGKLDEAESLYREALTMRRKLFGEDHPDVTTSYNELRRVLLQRGKLAELDALFDEWLAPAHEGTPRAVDALRQRGYNRARQGRFAEAIADITRVVQLSPTNAEPSHWLATLLVQTGQLEAYREECRKSLERFAQTTEPGTADRIAKDCLILPSSGVDPDAVARLAERAVTLDPNSTDMPWFRVAKGLSEYRQGKFASAENWMQQVLAGPGTDFERDVEAWSVIAMSRHQLKQPVEARAALVNAVKIANDLPKLEGGDLGEDWIDGIIARALLREATALMDGPPSVD